MASRLNHPTHQIGSELDNFEQLSIGDQLEAWCAIDYDFGHPLQVSAIRFGLDPLVQPSPVNSGESYQSTVIDGLDRDPVLSKAGVSVHDNDFDVTLSMKSPIWITGEHDWNAWAHLFAVVQSILPGIPKQLAINATPRGIGSPISKAGGEVKQIRRGTPITKHELTDVYVAMASSPFLNVMGVGFGQSHLEPCPICQADGSLLQADFEHGLVAASCWCGQRYVAHHDDT